MELSDKETVDWVITEEFAFSEQSAASKRVYEKILGKRGIWLVAVDVEDRGDYIYFDNLNDVSSQGFGGATLKFDLNDGGLYEAKGPWKSSSQSCYNDTGQDFMHLHRTFVVLSKEREYNKMMDVVYRDPQGGLLGRFDRYKLLAEQYPEARFYYSKSSGGSVRGPIPAILGILM